MPIRRTGCGRLGVGAALVIAALAGAMPASAAGASNVGGGGASWPVLADIATPSGQREVAERQAAGCALLGLGVTGLAMASGALTTAGTGGAATVPVGVALGEVVAYFGAGCTIGAFLAALPLFGFEPADNKREPAAPDAAGKNAQPPRVDREQVVTDLQPEVAR